MTVRPLQAMGCRSGRADNPDMTASTLRAADLIALHRSSTDGSLELLYQPEIDLQTGAIVAMEGLLRWHHGKSGMMGPREFLDMAENSGEIAPSGRGVPDPGAAGAAGGRGSGNTPRQLFLNVSAS